MGIARASSNLVRVDLRHPLDSSSLTFCFFSLATGKEGGPHRSGPPRVAPRARRGMPPTSAASASTSAASGKDAASEVRDVTDALASVALIDSDRRGTTAPSSPPSSSSTGGLVDVLLLDDAAACAAHLGPLIAARDPVAVDFEGVALGRSGRLCLAQVASANGPTLLVDVCAMGAAAFRRGRLGELLEDARVLKLVFDCRSDSAALHHQFGVKMRGVYDVQVAYCLKRDEEEGARVSTLQGLARALGECPGLDDASRAALEAVKEAGKALFAPERGGGYEVWERRPMPRELLEYAAADVAHLRAMWREWRHFVGRGKMDAIVEKRIRDAIRGQEEERAGKKRRPGWKRVGF